VGIHLIRPLLFSALLAVSCATTPVVVPPVPQTLRPVAIHTCVPGATVWLDGANVPPLRGIADANGNIGFPEFPSTVTAFNLHATAPKYPEYGAVLTATASTEPLIIFLGSCNR
jgi:hypothetical protein